MLMFHETTKFHIISKGYEILHIAIHSLNITAINSLSGLFFLCGGGYCTFVCSWRSRTMTI